MAKDSGLTHRQIQAAHEQYFQDIANAWNELQSSMTAIQTDLERATERAFVSQNADEYRNQLTEIQAASQEVWNEAGSGHPYEQAFRDYKANVQKAIASADLEGMTFTDIAHLGQSLSTVWPVAFSLAQASIGAQTAAAANPFAAEAAPTGGKGRQQKSSSG